MRLLVLGGTGFLGHHAVTAALEEGHEVSAFTRSGEAASGAQTIHGDRYGDLSELRGREWDAVLDTFSDPDAVARTAGLFSGSAGIYGFVSGITNYRPDGPDVVDEDSPLRTPDAAPPDDPLQERGLAKLDCEAAVRREFSGETFIARPGIMVGPRDPTDRFSWWPSRLARAISAGDEVLAPGDPDRPVQFTDARDLADWMVRMLGSGRGGVYNAVGPGRRESISSVLEACRAAASRLSSASPQEARLTWVDEDFLSANLPDVAEEERPLWFPEPQIPFAEVDSSRALAAGLRFRPALQTALDTLAYLGDRTCTDLAAGLSPRRERELLQSWRRART